MHPAAPLQHVLHPAAPLQHVLLPGTPEFVFQGGIGITGGVASTCNGRNHTSTVVG